MRKLSVAAVAFIALTTAVPALAASPMPIEAWNGWYVGGNFGASIGATNDTATRGASNAPFATSTTGLRGVVGGGQFGYNWHASPLWLVGLEADFRGASEQNSYTTPTQTVSGRRGA